MLYRHKQMNLIIFQINNYTDKLGRGGESNNQSKFPTKYSKYIPSG